MIDLTMFVADKSIRRRFLAKVAFCKHGKSCKVCCWLWKGYRDKQGRGRFKVKKSVTAYSVRFVYTIRYGHTSLQINHTCDIPACCNYHHLYAGTQADNMTDRKDRNRTPKGETHYKTRLRNADILHIFALSQEGHNQREIADLYGVTSASINLILRGKNWKHLI